MNRTDRPAGCRSPGMSSDSSCPDTAPVAHRIPPEFFELILTSFQFSYPRIDLYTHQSGEEIKANKHALGQWSLVARHWAKHCRQRIFERLALRSKEDALQLREFMQTTTGGMSIVAYVSDLRIHLTLPSPPWIHLILNINPSALPNLASCRIVVNFQDHGSEPGLVAPRTVFFGLPRSLPASRLRLRLELENLHFDTFRDFVSFVRSTKATEESLDSPPVSLTRISWSADSAQAPPANPHTFLGLRPVLCNSDSGNYISAIGCTAIWPLLWLVVTTEPRMRRVACYIDARELQGAAALVQTLVDACSCFSCARQRLDAIPASVQLYGSVKKGSNGSTCKCPMMDVEVKTKRLIVGCCEIVAWPRGRGHGTTFDVSSDGLIVQCRFYMDNQALREHPPESFDLGWGALDEQVAAFNPTMTGFSVVLLDEIYEAYAPYVRSRMPVAESSGRLQLEKFSDCLAMISSKK